MNYNTSFFIIANLRGLEACFSFLDPLGSMMKIPLKGLRSVPKAHNLFPINDILVSFLSVMINNEFSPHMFSNHSFGGFGIPFGGVSVDST